MRPTPGGPWTSKYRLTALTGKGLRFSLCSSTHASCASLLPPSKAPPSCASRGGSLLPSTVPHSSGRGPSEPRGAAHPPACPGQPLCWCPRRWGRCGRLLPSLPHGEAQAGSSRPLAPRYAPRFRAAGGGTPEGTPLAAAPAALPDGPTCSASSGLAARPGQARCASRPRPAGGLEKHSRHSCRTVSLDGALRGVKRGTFSRGPAEAAPATAGPSTPSPSN